MTNIEIAEKFYAAMSEKDPIGLEPHLCNDVAFFAPLAQTQGKDAYLENAKKFMGFFNSLTIRTICTSSNEATVVYDLSFPEPVGNVPTVALMNFSDGMIVRIELFYDARPFDKK